ncbi:MAG: nitroreductase family protein [Candidatus Bathyarchaeia archaeon]
MREDAGEAKRKGLSEIILCEPQELSNEASEIIDVARMAPSAMNSQPWRFEVQDGVIHLYIKIGEGFINKLGKALLNLKEMNWIDAGIALRHIQIAADRHLRDFEFRKIRGKEIDGLHYIISLVERN